MARFKRKQLLLLGTIFAYLLIGIEILIMITPFALYFYAVYGPILNFLAASPLTSWTTEFFLPHLVFPDDPLIIAISYLQILLVVGLLLFLTAAVPLYYGRFTGRGVVQFGFYSSIRHPQYLFLAISGFGLLLYWPRFIILIMYITMLFVYYLLARNEEWRMEQEQPEAYAHYRARTPMFLPGEPGGRIYRSLLGWLQPKWLGLVTAYFLVMVLAILLAVGLRKYAVAQLPRTTVEAMTLVSVFPRPAEEIAALYELARTSPEVRRNLAAKGINLVYIMPGDFFLTALVTEKNRRFSEEMMERFPEIIEWHRHKFKGGLGKFFKIFYNYVRMWSDLETDYSVNRLVFVRVADSGGKPVPPARVFEIGLQRTPALIVDLDAFTEEILAVVPAPAQHKWGTMPMPTF